MKLENVYEVLKTVTYKDIYQLPRNEKRFIFKDDIALSIEKIRVEKRFGNEYFFDRDGNPVQLNGQHDKLIKMLCELKDFPETYENIFLENILIKYNNMIVHDIECITISNYSSLHVTLPPTIKVLDYIFNICEIINYFDGGSTNDYANKILKTELNIIDSSFEDFLVH